MKSIRRNTLKTLIAGSVLSQVPGGWKRPVVDSVVLPVHAQTSGCVYFYGEDLPYGRFCISVCADVASVAAYMGGVDIDDTGTPKFFFEGSAAVGTTGTLTVDSSQSGNNCLSGVGGNFLSSRDFSVSISGDSGTLGIEEGDGDTWEIDINQVETCPDIPPLTDCED